MGESHARRWIGDADEMLAGRALNLPARKLCLALQRLIAVGTIEFEVVRTHGLYPHKRNLQGEGMPRSSAYFLPTESA